MLVDKPFSRDMFSGLHERKILNIYAAFLRCWKHEEVFFSFMEKSEDMNEARARDFIYKARKLARKNGFSDDYIRNNFKEINLMEI